MNAPSPSNFLPRLDAYRLHGDSTVALSQLVRISPDADPEILVSVAVARLERQANQLDELLSLVADTDSNLHAFGAPLLAALQEVTNLLKAAEQRLHNQGSRA